MSLRLKRQRSKKVKLSDQAANRSAARLQTLITKLTVNSGNKIKDPVVLRALVSRLELQRELTLKASRHAALRRLGRISPREVHPAVGRTALQLERTLPKIKRASAIRHLLSVKQMLSSERALNA